MLPPAGQRSSAQTVMAYEAICSYSGWLLLATVGPIIVVTIGMEIAASMLGSASVWRWNLGFETEFAVPVQQPDDATILTDPLDEAVKIGQSALGLGSVVVVLHGLLAMLYSSAVLLLEWRGAGYPMNCFSYKRWGRHALVSVLMWLVAIAVLCESLSRYVPSTTEGGLFGKGPLLVYQSSI